MVIDLFGLSIDEVRAQFPAVYQWVLERVKPERDQNNRASYRDNWWIFGEARRDWRAAVLGLNRYITTVETTKHRTFQILDAEVLPDNMLVNIATEDEMLLGVLSSRLHVAWSLTAGGTLEDRPRYNKSVCFETFPFPDVNQEQKASIRACAEKLDTHRKRQQTQYPELTITGMYNVLEKLRAGVELTVKDKVIHEQGLVSVLQELHDELDHAVFAAYGWEDLAKQLVGLPGATVPLLDKSEAHAMAEAELLTRLVDLNTQRAAEEARGVIRWLRPEYQNPSAIADQEQAEVDLTTVDRVSVVSTPKGKATWPKSMREQVAAVRLALQAHAMSTQDIAGLFKRSPLAAVQSVLDALQDLGMIAQIEGRYQIQR